MVPMLHPPIVANTKKLIATRDLAACTCKRRQLHVVQFNAMPTDKELTLPGGGRGLIKTVRQTSSGGFCVPHLRQFATPYVDNQTTKFAKSNVDTKYVANACVKEGRMNNGSTWRHCGSNFSMQQQQDHKNHWENHPATKPMKHTVETRQHRTGAKTSKPTEYDGW